MTARIVGTEDEWMNYCFLRSAVQVQDLPINLHILSHEDKKTPPGCRYEITDIMFDIKHYVKPYVSSQLLIHMKRLTGFFIFLFFAL